MSGPIGPGGGPPPGWYPDPEAPGSGRQRWWDGATWTSNYHPPAGQPATPGYAAPGYGGYAQPVRVDPWLWQSIVATLLCCLPAGVVGIIFASKSQSAAAVGDLAGAQRYAGTARTWTLVAVGVAALGIVTYIVLIFAMGATAFWM